MKISYDPLWKKLIDCNLSKTQMRTLCGLTTVQLASLGRNEPVNLKVLLKICDKLHCDVSDVVEFTEETPTDDVGNEYTLIDDLIGRLKECRKQAGFNCPVVIMDEDATMSHPCGAVTMDIRNAGALKDPSIPRDHVDTCVAILNNFSFSDMDTMEYSKDDE